jgi:hypothetical protein
MHFVQENTKSDHISSVTRRQCLRVLSIVAKATDYSYNIKYKISLYEVSVGTAGANEKPAYRQAGGAACGIHDQYLEKKKL